MNYKNRIALLVLAVFAFSFCAETSPPTKKDVMIAAWERAKAYTKEYLDAATDEVYSFKPTPEMRSFAEQMHHLTVDNYKITNAAVVDITTPAKFKDLEKEPPLMTKAEITKAVME